MAHQARASPGFNSMKRLRVFLLSPGFLLVRPSPFLLLSNAFSEFGSVGQRKKKTAKIKLEKESGARKPGTSA